MIELLVVIFILAVGLTGVSAMFVGGIISSRKAEHVNAAVNAARKEMERLRSGGFASCRVNSTYFPEGNGYTIVTQTPEETGEVAFAVPDLKNSQGSIVIAYYDSPTGIYPNLKDITVNVTWQGGGQTGGRISLRTLIANHP